MTTVTRSLHQQMSPPPLSHLNHTYLHICLHSFASQLIFSHNSPWMNFDPCSLIILSIRTNSMLTFDTHMQQRLSDPSRLLMVSIAHFQKGPTDYLFSYKKCFVCSQAWHITQSYSLQIQAGNDVHSKQ